MKNKKYMKPAVTSIFIMFVFLAVILVFLFGVAVPFLMATYVKIYNAGQDIMTSSDIQQSISQIQDPDMKASINATFVTAEGSVATNINILGYFFQFGWIVIIVIIAVMLFLKSRTLVETQHGIY